MSFSPFARFRNFTLVNMKLFFDVYPDMASKLEWNDAIKVVDSKMPGYKKTAYQQACQLGLEDRSGNLFKVQSYLYAFDDDNLNNYLEFWIKTYYAPNPYVNSTDTPMLIFCELAEEILLSPTLETDYDNFFKTRIGGGSDDILLNAIKAFGKPLQHKLDPTTKANILFINNSDKEILVNLSARIKRDFPIINPMDRKSFFERFNHENFCKFFHTNSVLPATKNKLNCHTGYSIPSSIPISYASGIKFRNRIVFGAPGTGKSYLLNADKDVLLGPNSDDYERVTFHSDYSYSQFVGTYKPISMMSGEIAYKFVPGPFMRILVKAYKNIIDATDTNGQIDKTKIRPFILLVEEINRARTAAVFGDVFQLLDRNKDGISEYEIQPSEDIRQYLAEKIGGTVEDYFSIQLPDNMFIWATMNSADQGVFPMDTAFKRRWNFNYIGIDDDEITEDSTGTKVENIKLCFKLNGDVIRWNVLRRAINAKLSSDTDDIRAHEDKLMGPFFVKCDQYTLDSSNIISSTTENDDFLSVFCEKVLMYLFEDVARTRRDELFEGLKGKCSRYSEVRAAFIKDGLEIFGKDFKTKYYDAEEKEYDDKKLREGV